MSANMTDQVQTICEGVLNALDDFDRAVPPFGLYASDELAGPATKHATWQAWQRALRPYFNSLGAGIGEQRFRPPTVSFTLPAFGAVELTLISVSTIKVRKFGSAYRMDRHERRDARWAERAFGKQISQFWKQQRAQHRLRMVVLVGYDAAERPLHKELQQLESALNWGAHGVTYRTRSWRDRYQREFGVRLCAFAKYYPNE